MSKAWRLSNATRQRATALSELRALLDRLGHPDGFTVQCGDPSCYQWRILPAGPVVSVARLRSWCGHGWLYEADQLNTGPTRQYHVGDVPHA